MSNGRVLVVDDDPKTAGLIRLYLEHDGFEVVVAYNGRQALDEAAAARPDLVVLDLMLPQVDGLEVCRRLRRESDVPIVMVTARTTEEDRLAGLDLGADDYVSKPFSPRELAARVRAVLRRTRLPGRAPVRKVGELEVDSERREARVAGTPVELTAREFALLEILAARPGRVFTREELVTHAFGPDYAGLDRTVDAHIASLRRKLEPDPARPRWVRTVYGAGYRLADGSDAP